MSATQFRASMEDIRFVLFEQLDIDEKYKSFERFASFDHDLYLAMLEEARRCAEDVLGPINRSGDRAGVSFDGKGNVTTPAGFKDAWGVMSTGGWVAVDAAPEFGGVGLPHVFGAVANELFSGAAMAFTMYMGLTAGVGRMLAHFGPEFARVPISTKLFTGVWGGTMCLTEAGAGSSVGDNRCKALPTGNPGEYTLEGEKIFISGGDQDLTENIIHMVLARTPEAPPGTKGLSLFLVPKFLFDRETLALGERNGAWVVGTEHKMGINASATCTLALGTQGPCLGWLVGNEGDGMEIMFTLMNEARIGVGLQGLAQAAAAHNAAVAYAKDRIQGTSVANLRDPTAARVAIIEHPDVRRMLLWQKVHVETMRSFAYKLANRADIAQNTDDDALRQKMTNFVDLLVPVLKSYCSDRGFDVTVSALQCFGGYGYTTEYPAEQYVRDVKIASIYEGTNAIQAMDLLGRKLRMKGGALFIEWMTDVQADLAAATTEGFGAQAETIGKALNQLGAAAMHVGGLGMQGRLDGAMLCAQDFLDMMGNICLAIEALDQARVAKRLIARDGDNPHLVSKAIMLDFYLAYQLPKATALGKSITGGFEQALDARLFS